MRIQILRKLTPSRIDPQSDQFQPGFQYEVDSTMGQLFIAEGWASLVVEEEPGLIVPQVEMEHVADEHSATQHYRERTLPSLKNAIAADIAFDDAIAAAIERQGGPQYVCDFAQRAHRGS
jgi:hypothetical protein